MQVSAFSPLKGDSLCRKESAHARISNVEQLMLSDLLNYKATQLKSNLLPVYTICRLRPMCPRKAKIQCQVFNTILYTF